MDRKPRWLQHVFNRLPVYYRSSRSHGIKTTSREIPEWSKFDQESRSRANRVLGSLRNFHFLIVWTMVVKVLSHIKGPIKKIQGRGLDLYEVVDAIRNTQTDLKLLRSEESHFYQRCYDYDYYRVNICSPFLEHLTEDIEQRLD